jgi:hypothetical protein
MIITAFQWCHAHGTMACWNTGIISKNEKTLITMVFDNPQHLFLGV